MNAMTVIGISLLLILVCVLYRYSLLKQPMNVFGWGPPWDMRFVPAVVALLIVVVYILSPHSHVAHVVSNLISGWFR
jgi:hypothetical protein